MKHLYFTNNIFLGFALNIGIALLLALLFVGNKIFKPVFDINIHDTYFIITPWHFLTAVFLLVLLLVFCINKIFIKG